jgi:hypothetical protein
MLIWPRFTAQVETLLKTQDPSDPVQASNLMQGMTSTNYSDIPGMTMLSEPAESLQQAMSNNDMTDPHIDSMMDNLGLAPDQTFSWELISLGLEEPLPTQDIIDDM